MLEEEERLEAERETTEEEESRVAKKKRLKAARELQKAMGRALVKNVRDFKAKEEKTRTALLQVDTTASAEKSKSLKPKKSVSFDLPPEESPVSASPQQDWGDITPGQVQLEQPLTSAAHGPMKYRVIERFPRKLHLAPPSKDSDDESDPESVPDSDEDSEPAPAPAPVDHVEFHSDESTEDGGDFEFDEGETDLGAAQHQREIALAYYEKREKFAAQAAGAFSSHSHIEEDSWDRPVGPLPSSLMLAEILMHTPRRFHSKRVSRVIGQNQPSPNSKQIGSFLRLLPSTVSSCPHLNPPLCEIPSSWESLRAISSLVILRIVMMT